MILKRIFILIAAICVFSQIYLGASTKTEITYFPRERDCISSLLKSVSDCDSQKPIIVLELTKMTENRANPQSLEIRGNYVPFSLEFDTIGENVRKLGNASNRVIVSDSISVPVVFDFEININTKVFKNISVQSSCDTL